MDYKLASWIIVFSVIIGVWFQDSLRMDIDYERHKQLIDPATGNKRKPSEMFDLKKVILQSDDYINSTDAQERLYDLAYNLNFENPFVFNARYSRKQDLLKSGWPVANQDQCGQQVNWILDQLNAHRNYTFLKGRLGYELSTFMDTFGKPESGLYGGAVHWMGGYQRCVKHTLDNGNIKTRYCIANMRPKSWPKNETMDPQSSIRIGFCLPETCDTLSFNRFNNSIETLVKFELPQIHQQELEMKSMFCLPDERSPLRKIPLAGWTFLQVMVFWLATVLIATLVHEVHFKRKRHLSQSPTLIKDPKQLELPTHLITCQQLHDEDTSITSNVFGRIVEALSVRSAVKSFKTNTFRIRYSQGQRVRVDLSCINFFKVIMSLLIILAHSSYLAMIFMRSLSIKVDLCTSELARLSLSISRCVDTYFVFFGVLTTYSLMRKCNPKQLSNPLVWLAVNLGVLLKIAPLFVIVYMYARFVSPYTGAGPWWDYGVDKYSMKGVCMADPWWKAIPYFGSAGSPGVPTCNLPSWFIVSYTQISLLLPLITYILYKLPRNIYRFLMIGILVTISTASISIRLYKQTSVNTEAFSLYGGFLSSLLEKFESTGHMATLGRLGSVSIGCLVGFLLRKYELCEIVQWPRWLRSGTTVAVTVILHVIIVFLPVIGHRIYQATGRLVSREEFVGFNALTMIAWPILNSILILNYTTVNNHRAPARFCSHTFWHTFNKLGLLIYLTHWEILFIAITNFEQAPSYGFVTDVMKLWSFGIFVSIIVAFTIYILFEEPLQRLLMLAARPFIQPGNAAQERR